MPSQYVCVQHRLADSRVMYSLAHCLEAGVPVIGFIWIDHLPPLTQTCSSNNNTDCESRAIPSVAVPYVRRGVEQDFASLELIRFP